MGKQRPTRRKLAQFFNWSVKIHAPDRVWAGILMGLDRHMNLVLHHAQEIRSYKIKGHDKPKEVRRQVGLVILRGTEVISVVPERHCGSNFVFVKSYGNMNKTINVDAKKKLEAEKAATASAAAQAAAAAQQQQEQASSGPGQMGQGYQAPTMAPLMGAGSAATGFREVPHSMAIANQGMFGGKKGKGKTMYM